MRDYGFKPILAGAPEILILGSMPSAESLRHQQYYAHPRNLFWEIMSELLNFPIALDYQARTKHLSANQIALWDVIASCERPGSLDSAIINHSIRVNDFAALFREYPSITHVFFNGRKAESEFRKRVMPSLPNIDKTISFDVLPSTSPANAGISKAEKLRQWHKITTILNHRS